MLAILQQTSFVSVLFHFLDHYNLPMSGCSRLGASDSNATDSFLATRQNCLLLSNFAYRLVTTRFGRLDQRLSIFDLLTIVVVCARFSMTLF